MNRDELRDDMQVRPPVPGELVYVERRDDSYFWKCTTEACTPDTLASPPDAWIFYSGPWPTAAPGRMDAFVDDLLAEMESMTGGSDRCRWPLDEPWPHGH